MPDAHSIINRIAKTVYVVLYKTRPSPRYPTGQLTLLTEPGEGTVWSSKVKGIADFHAKENGGEARTWEDAWRLLVKEYGTLERLEDDLIQRAVEVQKATSKVDLSRRPASDRPGVRMGNNFNDNINPNN